MSIFRKSIRPALNIGLSVTRVGNAGQSSRQKDQGTKTLKFLADYRQAEEYSHFGSEMSGETKKQLLLGKKIFELLTQGTTTTFSLMSQQLMLEVVLRVDPEVFLDIDLLKKIVPEYSIKVKDDSNYEPMLKELIARCVGGATK